MVTPGLRGGRADDIYDSGRPSGKNLARRCGGVDRVLILSGLYW
jgi:hypothetical protein